MRRIHDRFALTLLCALLSTQTAQARQVPDAGQAMRAIESSPLTLPQPSKLGLTLPDDQRVQARTGGPTLFVSSFRLSGNQVFSDTELLSLLDDLQGSEMTLNELHSGVQRLTDYYRERGYLLARAYLPAQKIGAGVVRIVILEGHYGEIEVHNDSRLLASVLAPLEALQPGDAVRAGPLERSLLLLSDIPGVKARATLRPGAHVGASDLIVDILPGPLIDGSVGLDNYGNRYTGARRLSGTLNLNNPLGLGDLLSLRAMGSDERQLYYRAAYQLPVGPWMTRLGVAYSDMDYELAKDFEDLEAHGNAKISSLFMVQPLIRSRDVSLYGRLQFDDKRLTDEIELFDSRSDKRSRVGTVSLTGNVRDGWGGGGITGFVLAYSHGRLTLDDELDRLLDDLTARTRGDFNIINASLQRLQRLNDRFSLHLQLQGQWSDRNLDSSEKFSLGGPYGVRAYPQGEALGDQGWLINAGLRYALTRAWRLEVFVDHGEVRLSKNPWREGDNHRELSGIGIGADWIAKGWQVTASAAWKLGAEEPQSGEDRSPRVWAQVVRYF